MPKQGEMTYLSQIGEAGARHAMGKPFSDPHAGDMMAEMSILLRLLPKPPRRLLDMGCGTGWTSVWFARCGYEVLGVDISQEMIDAAEVVASGENLPHLSFIARDYENLGIREEYDCATFIHSLHHAEDEEAAIRCVYQALKPGGVCVTCEPGDGHGEAEMSRNAVEKYGVTEKDMPPRHIIQLARKVGFRKTYAFPMLAVNLIKDYRWSDGTNESASTPPPVRRGVLRTFVLRPARRSLDVLTGGLSAKLWEKLSLFRLYSKYSAHHKKQGDGFAVLVK